jgi:hypothetical protein
MARGGTVGAPDAACCRMACAGRSDVGGSSRQPAAGTGRWTGGLRGFLGGAVG